MFDYSPTFLQVDSTSCLCRVDASLKIVVGAKKYVPGTKLCLQLDINHPFIQQGTSLHDEIEAGINPFYFVAYPMTWPSRVSLGYHEWNAVSSA
ncbi:hypothetical protein NL676_039794 [Syzygium grande]|nr:hypothetical protein NL676_039794 [Syzygium grande]